MNNFDEVIFNLFIIQFVYDYKPFLKNKSISEELYHLHLLTNDFKMMRNLFPANEVCDEAFFYTHNSGKVKSKIYNYIED